MSTVSPVFHTEAKVSIGLKNILRVETPAFKLTTLNVKNKNVEN